MAWVKSAFLPLNTASSVLLHFFPATFQLAPETLRRRNAPKQFITLVLGLLGVLSEAKFFYARNALGNFHSAAIFK